MSVISNVNSVGATVAGLSPCAFLFVKLAKTQFFDQVKINSTSQIISAIFKLLQNYLNVLVE